MSLFEVKNQKSNVITLKSTIEITDIAKKIANALDYDFTGDITTDINIPKFPTEFEIGLIYGSSGSGKSTLLKLFGEEDNVEWDNTKCIADNFNGYEDAIDKLGASGLNTMTTWLQPYNTLSTGQKFRADLARRIHSNSVIDEYTSVVNRECAKCASISLKKYITSHNLKNIVFASCHDDIIDWLMPDWTYNTDTKELSVGRSARQRPRVVLEVHQCRFEVWSMFKKYHYLSSTLLSSADNFLITFDKIPIAFISARPLPGRFRDDKLAILEHRIVIFPDYQGLGIGNIMSEYVADLYTSNGYLYYSKTANPRLGEHRNKSELWESTSSNGRASKANGEFTENEIKHNSVGQSLEKMKAYARRVCYSHRYIANDNLDIPKAISKEKAKQRSKKLF